MHDRLDPVDQLLHPEALVVIRGVTFIDIGLEFNINQTLSNVALSTY